MPTRQQQLQDRARMYQNIRAFFDGQGFLEVDTPLLGISSNSDSHIHSIKASVMGGTVYLQTSPEFAMKRLLAEGSGSIYQICHAFRDEEKGRLHNPEFSLLEWYSLGFNYRQLMDQVESLLGSLLQQPARIPRMAYFDCFQQVLGLDLVEAGADQCREAVIAHIPGVDTQALSRDDCLDLLMSQVVAKTLKGFNFIYDYPASQAALARIKPDNPCCAERFELFHDELELANGFSELTDPAEQRRRFEQDNLQRQRQGRETIPLDEAFLQALETGLPDCAGVAIGLDRLLMVLGKCNSIDQVLTLDTLGN